MSAQQSSPAASPPAGSSTSTSDAPGDESHRPIESAAPSEAELPLGTADLAELLANGQWDGGGNTPVAGEAGTYDGHVALALDTGYLPELDTTLDLLTSSHQLFDVPVLDVTSGSDDTSSA